MKIYFLSILAIFGAPLCAQDGMNCADDLETLIPTAIEKSPIDRTIHEGNIKDSHGNSIKISVISLEYARELFNEMSSQECIPFGYPEGGCYARAHKMSRLLEDKGVISGKVWIKGNLRVDTLKGPKDYVEWGFHVAPIVKVKNGEKEEVYVIDPSVSSAPVSIDEWPNIQTQHRLGRIDSVQISKRFNFYINSLKDMHDWDEKDMEEMDYILQTFLRIQEERDIESVYRNYLGP